MSKYAKKKPPMEFSKKILYFSFTLASLITIFSFVMIWRTDDLTPLTYLIPAVFVEVAAASGFYYNKAKAENLLEKSKIVSEDMIQHIKDVL